MITGAATGDTLHSHSAVKAKSTTDVYLSTKFQGKNYLAT